MNFKYNDGGRKAAGFRGSKVGDCACRAVAIATERPYEEIHALINYFASKERMSKSRRKHGRSDADHGVFNSTLKHVMSHLGWEWVPCMGIGTGCKVHLDDGELPMGRIVCRVSKHFTALVDGVINDTYNPARGGDRCVYGYYRATDRSIKPTDSIGISIPTEILASERVAKKSDTAKPKGKKRPTCVKTPRYDEHGYLVFTLREMRRAVVALIPSEFRPYYTGCEIEKAYEGKLTADNSEIFIYFKKPVCGPIGDSRYIHCSLMELTQELDACFLGDGLYEDGYYDDYDAEYGDRKVVEIRAPAIETSAARREFMADWKFRK